MSLVETLEKLGKEAEDYEEITGIDNELAHIALDSKRKKLHQGLLHTTIEEVDTAIDEIFTKAIDGNPRAKFVVYAAAHNAVKTGDDAAKASDVPVIPTEGEIALLELTLDCNEEKSKPVKNRVGLAEVDAIIGLMELTIENVSNGIFIPEDQ